MLKFLELTFANREMVAPTSKSIEVKKIFLSELTQAPSAKLKYP